MRAGTTLTQLVEFTDGHPDADITWELLDGRGQQVANGSVVPAADAVSAIITLTADDNALEAGALASPRELSWAYSVGGLVYTGRRRYRLEAFLPLGVSADGVRAKLGLESHELEDEAIDLVSAYSQFQERVTAATLDAVTGLKAILACDAIEAIAGLALLATLPVKLASKQSSGTDQFQRGKTDWAALRAQLEATVAAGLTAVAPTIDETGNFGPLVVPVVRSPDPVTGA
jgi:hypothetical protein